MAGAQQKTQRQRVGKHASQATLPFVMSASVESNQLPVPVTQPESFGIQSLESLLHSAAQHATPTLALQMSGLSIVVFGQAAGPISPSVPIASVPVPAARATHDYRNHQEATAPYRRKSGTAAMMLVAGVALAAVATFALALVRPGASEGQESKSKGLQNVQADTITAVAGVKHGLLMGGELYDHWTDLSNPIRDARGVSGVLCGDYGFQTQVIENPTVEQFYQVLSGYTQRAYGPNDQVFIYYGGHGDFCASTKEGFLVLRDSRTAEADPMRTSFIPHSRLRDIIEKIPCKHVFVVLDVCFGGTFDFGTAVHERGYGHQEEIECEAFVARKMARASRRYLTSGACETVPDGVPGEHSPFAGKLIDLLRRGGVRVGILASQEILPVVECGSCAPCYGTLRGDEGGDFLFVRKAPN